MAFDTIIITSTTLRTNVRVMKEAHWMWFGCAQSMSRPLLPSLWIWLWLVSLTYICFDFERAKKAIIANWAQICLNFIIFIIFTKFLYKFLVQNIYPLFCKNVFFFFVELNANKFVLFSIIVLSVESHRKSSFTAKTKARIISNCLNAYLLKF